MRLSDGPQVRSRIHEQFGANVEDVAMPAGDGALLRAWFVQPSEPNGKAVVLLHGMGANRIGASGFGDIFLRRGYSILLPDSRAHGESGGEVATYGILERDDVRRWVAWLKSRAPGCSYLFGESMGAEISLQASAITPGLCAVVVEDSYSEFREIGYERLGRATKLGTTFWKTLGSPALEVAIAYSRIRYGVTLPDASPKKAVERSRVPTLLITGTADENIPMHHAEELERACSGHCALWVVQGADHGGATTVTHAEFERRVGGWVRCTGRWSDRAGPLVTTCEAPILSTVCKRK